MFQVEHDGYIEVFASYYFYQYRLNQISAKYPNKDITLDTTQKTYKFYERFKFKVTQITRDFYAQGLDRYDMLFIK